MSQGNFIFNMRYNTARKEVPFNKLWLDDGGRFSFALDPEFMPNLKPGELGKSITSEEKPRRIIFIGTPLGPALIYEKPTGPGDYAFLISPALQDTGLFPGYSETLNRDFFKVWNEVCQSLFELLLGNPYDEDKPFNNLGFIIQNIRGRKPVSLRKKSLPKPPQVKVRVAL